MIAIFRYVKLTIKIFNNNAKNSFVKENTNPHNNPAINAFYINVPLSLLSYS